MCFCLFVVVVKFSVFGSATSIEGDGGGAVWNWINGGEELLRIKSSKGMRIRNGRRRIERMKKRSSGECISPLERVRDGCFE